MILDNLFNNYNTLDQQPLNNNITIPLIYSIIENHIYENVILIHDKINNPEQFALYANPKSLSIIYNELSSNDELMQLLNKYFTDIKRIAFVFHNSNINGLKEFTNNKPLFDYNDLSENLCIDKELFYEMQCNKTTEYSLNMQFIINISNQFNVQNLDYLACNTLLFEHWNKYFDILKEKTKATIGASNNLTGNIKYGGDWVLENKNEDIRNIYFNDDIENYQYTLIGGVYTVTYYFNGGTGSIVDPESTSYNIDSIVTISQIGTLAKAGYTFSGWNDGTSTYNSGNTFNISRNIYLTALWTIIATTTTPTVEPTPSTPSTSTSTTTTTTTTTSPPQSTPTVRPTSTITTTLPITTISSTTTTTTTTITTTAPTTTSTTASFTPTTTVPAFSITYIPVDINGNGYALFTKLYNQFYDNMYKNQLFKQLKDQLYKQFKTPDNNTKTQKCYSVDYSGLKKLTIASNILILEVLNIIFIEDSNLSKEYYTLYINKNAKMKRTIENIKKNPQKYYNNIYKIFNIPLYAEIFNLLYIPLYNSIYQKLNNEKYTFIPNKNSICKPIILTLTQNSSIYKLYENLKDQLLNELYKELLPILCEELRTSYSKKDFKI